MKKILSILIIMLFVSTAAYAAGTVNHAANATVGSVLSVEFASTTDCTFGSGSIAWANADPGSDTGNLIAPDGAARGTGAKSDTAIIARSNGTVNWYMKMALTGTLAGKVKRAIGQPKVRVASGAAPDANGTVAGGIDTYVVIPGTATTAYSSGTNDKSNTPFGTFVGVNYALDGTGLAAGTYSGTITYTIATTP